MNKNKYKLFGRIIAALSGEYPPLVSKKFTNNVMARINKDNKKNIFPNPSRNFINYAASILGAITTSYILVTYENQEVELSVDTNFDQPYQDKDIIKRVVDENPCDPEENKELKNDNDCK